MIRYGALALGLSMAALWTMSYTPTSVDAFLRPVAAGLVVVSITLLILTRERACPTCLAAARLDAMERHPAGRRREPLDTLVVEDEHETSTPAGVPIVDEAGRQLDDVEAEQLLDELDPLVDTDPGPGAVRVPAYTRDAVRDPWGTVELPVIR